MRDAIFFVGRFHVLVLHLPIGILLAVIGLEWLARKPRYAHLAPAAQYLWFCAALTAVVTVALGYMHLSEGGFDGPSAVYHRLFGTLVAVVTVAMWLLGRRMPSLYRRIQLPGSVTLLILVMLTGHYGGNLTHGSTYLVEYAPAPLRALVGAPVQRRQPATLAEADVYLDIVQPLFDRRCISCHNEDKRRGGLSLVSHAALVQGGDSGPVVVAAKPEESDLHRRISLSAGDKDVMPAEGKTLLTGDQREIIRWWIEQGAAGESAIDPAQLSPQISQLLTVALGLGDEGSVQSGSVSVAAEAPIEIVDALVQSGFNVRLRSRTDPRLLVTAVGLRQLGNEQISALQAAAPHVLELELRRVGIGDADLKALAQMSALSKLDISGNSVSDAGLGELRGLENLETLNLRGNRGITGAGVDAVASLPQLKKMFVWETAIDAQEMTALRTRHPALELVGASGEPARVPVSMTTEE